MPKKKQENTATNAASPSKTRNRPISGSNTDIGSEKVTQLKKLTCPVCCDKFKTPKILQCGHSFCQQCLDQLFQSQHIRCPVCKSGIEMPPDNSAAKLPTNYALKALVEDGPPFDKDLINRSFGQCPIHSETCDQFCNTCERQLCKQCVSNSHIAPDHDTSPVLAVIVQHTEMVENLAVELGDAAKRLKIIEDKIATSERTCESQSYQLCKEINSSVAHSSQSLSVQGDSLRTVVEDVKKDLFMYLKDLRTEHSELSLSATYAIDLCQSLQIDLVQNNLSRVSVIKRLNYSKGKIKNRLGKLEGKKKVFNLGLRFQSSTEEPKAGKLIRSQSSIPVARHMRTIPLTQLVGSSNTCLQGFVWPVPYWMMAVSVYTVEKHYVAEFNNLHFFVEKNFTHEIGIDSTWSYVSNSDYGGKYALCLAVGKVHKLLLPSKQDEQKAGKIVSTVFLPSAVSAISWDEKREGCYAFLKEKKTLLHVEFEGQNRYKEVAALGDELSYSKTGFHGLHVNAEGSMAICDRIAEAVFFFEEIGAEPTLTVKAPLIPDLEDAIPHCVNTRRGDKNWYVLWRGFVDDDLCYCLAVYDSSFKLMGCVENLVVTQESFNGDKVMFCFQEDYLAVIAGNEVALHVLL